jgi:hypothetical protein
MADVTDRPPRSGDLAPGDHVLHRDGSVERLHRRKDDGSGWWLASGGGIADWVLDETGDWIVVGRWLFDALEVNS